MKKMVLFIVLIASLGLQAQTIHTVINTNDSGAGSLRAAANSVVAGDTIRFSPFLLASGSDSIVLTTGEIAFGNKGVIIKGLYTTTDTLYISGNNSSRIFSFSYAGRIILDSLVLVNGNGTGFDSGKGGAIYSEDCMDTLFIENSAISRNSALYKGGGIYSISFSSITSSVIIKNSIISENIASNEGGGVYSFSLSSPSIASLTSYVNVINSTISENKAFYSGGGVFSASSLMSSVNVINSTISGNIATHNGGGVYSGSNSDTSYINVISSTISGNIASLNGGGIYSVSASPYYSSIITVINSTVSGNTASNYGGGIASSSPSSSSINITNSTVSENSGSNGEGVSSSASSSFITILSSIVSENGNNSSGIYNTQIPTITSNGYNIFSDAPIGSISSDNTNITATQLNLHALGFNGGTTQTMKPGVGSIAIDHGNPNDSSNAQNAPIVGTRDIGAVESCFALPTSIYVTECSGYTVPSGNATYMQSGIFYDTIITACGADSVITINLISKTQHTDVVIACNSYTWINGVTYTSSNNTAIDTLMSSGGCDSIITLDLTILSSSSFTEVITSCNSIIWMDGVTYNQTTSGPTHTLMNSQGCDSVVKLDFTLLDVDISVTRNDFTLTAQATNATYQWIDCSSGPIVGATNASFIATENGNYQVEVTQNGCVDTSACFAIMNVGVQEVELIGVSLYPNPTSDVLHIDKGSNNFLEITISNTAGAIVYQSISKKQITSINMYKMATGIYVVALKNELGVKEERVVKR